MKKFNFKANQVKSTQTLPIANGCKKRKGKEKSFAAELPALSEIIVNAVGYDDAIVGGVNHRQYKAFDLLARYTFMLVMKLFVKID